MSRTLKLIRSISVILIIAYFSLLSACSFPDFGSLFPDPAGTPQSPPPSDPVNPVPPAPEQIFTSAEMITLQWDPPAQEVTSYDVYYRVHDGAAWQVLGNVPAVPAPQLEVLHSAMGNGTFDFAVVAVNGASRSGYHTSLDSNADPTTGWYLEWN